MDQLNFSANCSGTAKRAKSSKSHAKTSKDSKMKLAHSLLAGAALAVSMTSAAHAADLLTPVDPIYSSPLFDFEGLYVGVQGGGS